MTQSSLALHPEGSPSTLEAKQYVMKITLLTRFLFSIVLILAALPLASHLARPGTSYLVFLEDDLFYYVEIAKNIVSHGMSSFDGITLTNGYHPLWMGVITVLAAALGTGKALFATILGLSIVSSIVTFELALRLALRLFRFSLALMGALLIGAMFVTQIVMGGMEVVVTFPVMAYLFLRFAKLREFSATSTRWWLVTGLVSSVLILSRLDSMILVALLAGGTLLLDQRPLLSRAKAALACLAGLTPLLIYFVWNRIVFGDFMTVSSQAKQLQHGFHLNTQLPWFIWMYRHGKLAWLTVIPAIVVLFASKSFRIREPRSFIALLTLLFPVVYFLIYAVRISWFVHGWYFYSLPLALITALTVLCERLITVTKREKLMQRVVLTVCSIVAIANVIPITKRGTVPEKDPATFYQQALVLRDFTRQHPGVYAMGDYAGITAFLCDVPIIQLEGLAADRRLLEHIDHEDDLQSVLHEYHADYLIEASWGPLPAASGGYTLQEPHQKQAGLTSKHMSTVLTQQPVLVSKPEVTSGLDPDDFVSAYVFKL